MGSLSVLLKSEKMQKHAYLIIANRNPGQLQTLLTLLDDSRNDIYLLVDRKAWAIRVTFS